MNSETVAPKLRPVKKLPGRRAGLVLGALLVASLALPSTGLSATDSASVASSSTVDISDAIAPDGTFNGRAGLAGTIDVGSWSLVSDISADEPPRLGRTDGTSALVPQGEPGPSWDGLGSNGAGDGAIVGTVTALAVQGSNLFVGGTFTNAAGIPEADFIARWNGSAWSALGSNGTGNGALSSVVNDLVVSGGDLYVAGQFTNAAGIPEADFIARWNGSNWFALGSNGAGNGALTAMARAVVVSGTDIYVGGNFFDAAGIAAADRIARWNGSNWFALGSDGTGNGTLTGNVWALHASGSEVHVGGEFLNAFGDASADYVALWNGSTWSALGSNGAGDGALNGLVTAFARSGGDVFVGGLFTNAGADPTADKIARWNGTTWSGLGSNGAGDGALNSNVQHVAMLAGDVYVGGDFNDAAGILEADAVAAWDGSNWSAVGSSGDGGSAIASGVLALAFGVDQLYVGGGFINANGIAEADFVASYGPLLSPKPDGRIRKGSGTYVGNNIYNADGTNQSKSGKKPRGSTITFGITTQNDGNGADRFTLQATGSATTKYRVRYFRGTTEITAAVVAGTYQTPLLAPGGKYLITAKVKVKSTATIGSSVSRLVTIRSVADTTKLDAVKFTGKRG